MQPLHPILHIPLILLSLREIYLFSLIIRQKFLQLRVSDINILLYLGLFNQPLFRIRGLHKSFGLFVQNYEHVGQCAGDVDACVVLVSGLFEKCEFPTLVHSQVFSVDYDLSLVLPRGVDEVQACGFVVSEDEDGVFEPWHLKHAVTVESKQLSLIPLIVLYSLEDSIESHDSIIRVIPNPDHSILKRHYLKLLILLLPADLQPPLKIINRQHEITLHMDHLILRP